MAVEQPGEVSVCDLTSGRLARREQRPDTKHPRFRVIAANKCEAALAPSRAAAFGKSFMVIVISLCCLNMFFSAQHPTLVDKGGN